MKVIRNISAQGISLVLKEDKGFSHFWLKPRKSIVVPEKALTKQIATLTKRNMLTLNNA